MQLDQHVLACSALVSLARAKKQLMYVIACRLVGMLCWASIVSFANPAKQSPHVIVTASMAGAAAALAANQHALMCAPQAAASLLRALHGKQGR